MKSTEKEWGGLEVGLELLNQSISVAELLLCVFGIVQILTIGKLDDRSRRYFLRYYACLLLFVGSNLTGQFLRGMPGMTVRWALLVSNYSEFLFSGVLAYIGARYLLSLIDPERRLRWAGVGFSLLLLLHFLLLCFSQVTELLYFIDEQNLYHRTALYPLSLAGPMLILLVSSALLIRYRERLTKRERWAFFVYLAIPLAAIAAQPFVYGVYLILLATVTSVFTMHMFILADQMERYSRQVQKGAQLKVDLMLNQIQPHFLFNCMGTIQALCLKDPETAALAMSEFAEFLRHNISSVETDRPILFHQELLHIQNYLALQKLRFGDDLNIVYDLDCENFSLPTLTLQPLVENALTHGIRQSESGKGTVIIRTRELDDHYEASVIDDGVGFDPSAPASGMGSHIALKNIRERLARVSGGSLHIVSAPGMGASVTIQIPKTLPVRSK